MYLRLSLGVTRIDIEFESFTEAQNNMKHIDIPKYFLHWYFLNQIYGKTNQLHHFLKEPNKFVEKNV